MDDIVISVKNLTKIYKLYEKPIDRLKESGELEKNAQTITLGWYQDLIKWHQIIKNAELYGGILDI